MREREVETREEGRKVKGIKGSNEVRSMQRSTGWRMVNGEGHFNGEEKYCLSLLKECHKP